MTKLEELAAAMRAADAEVTKLHAEEMARRAHFERAISAAREKAFAASCAWQAEAKAQIHGGK